MNKFKDLNDLRDNLVIKTNKTPILLFFRILFSIVLVDIIFFLIISFVDFINIEKWGFFINYSYEENLFFLFIFLHLFFFIYLFVYWFIDYYKINNGKIHHIDWILFRKKEIFLIRQINAIELYQSFLWRLFNYWNIILFYSEKKIILKSIPYPEEFINFIELFRK